MLKKSNNKIFNYFNIYANIIIILFIVVILVKAASFRNPWTASCYSCKKCTSVCILGIDPSQFLTAANLNAPNLYIAVNNLRMKASDAADLDSNMNITFNKKELSLSEAFAKKMVTREDIIFTSKLRAKDAAKFCIKCKSCSNLCPLNLPIVEVVKKLEKNK